MEGRAALRLDRFENRQGIKPFAGVDHGRTVGHASQVAEDHSKTVVERNRNADPIVLCQPHRFADKEAVIENIVMG